MSKALVVRSEKRSLALVARARQFVAAAQVPNTRRAYEAGWADFKDFFKDQRASFLQASAENVASYLTMLGEGQTVSTLQVKLAAISFFHQAAKLPDLAADGQVRILMDGIRRERGTAPVKKAPLTLDEIRPLIEALPDSLKGKRDRAILLVGFAGAFRRLELCALIIADLNFAGKLTIRIRKSKTDQTCQGMVKVLPRLADPLLCPVTARRALLDGAAIEDGPVFRTIDRWGNPRTKRLSGNAIALIVKECAPRAGMDADRISAHSLRSGFITKAANSGVPSRDIMAQTGHKSETVVRGYIQDAGLGASVAVKAAFREQKVRLMRWRPANEKRRIPCRFGIF